MYYCACFFVIQIEICVTQAGLDFAVHEPSLIHLILLPLYQSAGDYMHMLLGPV